MSEETASSGWDAVDAATLVLIDFEAADEVIGLTGRVDRAVEGDALDAGAAERWLDGLRTADGEGSFFASLTLYTVTGTVPATSESEQGDTVLFGG